MQTFVQERDGDLLVVRADGGLDRDTAQQLIDDVGGHVDAGARNVIVDCSRVEMITSAGFGTLLRLHGAMKAKGATVRLAGVRGMAAQALRLLRLDGMFELFPDVNSARLAFRPKA